MNEPLTGPRTTVSLQIPVPTQLLRDLLCTAIEGGSNYWAAFSGFKRDSATGDYSAVRVWDVEEGTERGKDLGVVHADDLVLGLERLGTATFPTAMQHLSNALSDNGWDAETADVVLQMTVFGDLIYG